MGPLGWPETVFIFFLALILFGPKKLPELGRTVGKALTEFRRASNELKSTFDREMKSLEQETESFREVANQYQADTYNYDYSSYESTYEGSYGNENYDSTATTPSTLSASATQDAESPTGLPEGTVAHGSETIAAHETGGHTPETPGEDPHAKVSPAEHNA
ncbi:MAG: sec-independent translocation protein [Candidatus Solibacter sp.]|jgi:sec-independent protein translocase protein TatA|nr:sec-independent translocation protein [Candidatus Solibacter sp.]